MAEWSEVLVNGRWPLLMPPHRVARPWWPWYERERLMAMRAAVRPGDVVVDVGGEQGDMSALWGTWGADVVIVEPQPGYWPCIRATWEANVPARDPLACLAAFADETSSGEVRHDHSGEWPPVAFGEWVDEPGYQHLSEDGPTGRVRLDDVLPAAGVERVDVVTIDVEGAEFRVLRGALGVLTERRPTVMLSLHGWLLWDRYREMSDDLLIWCQKVAGYDPHFLAYDHEQHVLLTPRP